MSRLYPCVYCTEDGYCKKYSDDEVTSWCVQGPCKDVKPSNADRIRQMSDEELARFLWQAAPYDNCPPIKCIQFETRKKPTTDECIACWGRWLKAEVTYERT